MAFPTSPVNGEVYTNALGTRYVYNSTNAKWVILYQDVGVTGPKGLDGITGPQGPQGMNPTGMLSCTVTAGSQGWVNNGTKGFVVVPYNCRFFNWTLVATNAGYCEFNLGISTYAAFSTQKGMHTGVAGPVLSGSNKNTGSTSTWLNPTGTAGDIITFQLTGATGIQSASLNLGVSPV